MNSSDYKFLFEQINKSVQLEDSDIDIIQPKLIRKSLNKGEFLLEPGQVSEHMNFIVKGCMRSFLLDQKGNENTLQIGVEGWWINDLYSYIRQKESRMYLEALEATTILRIEKKQLESIFKDSHPMLYFFHEKIKNAYVALQERTIEKMSVDAFENYKKFLEDYRVIEQRVSQRVLASYLGVTPEFFSLMRKKYVNNRS